MKEWKEDTTPKALTEKELIERAGDYAFQLHFSHGYTVADALVAINGRIQECRNGYEEAMSEMQFKREQ